MGRPAINTVFNPVGRQGPVQPDRRQSPGDGLRRQVPHERHQRPQVLLEPRHGRRVLERAGRGARRRPDPRRARLQPHEHAARAAQRPGARRRRHRRRAQRDHRWRPARPLRRSRRHRRRAERRRRSAHRLPRRASRTSACRTRRGPIGGRPIRAALRRIPDGTHDMTAIASSDRPSPSPRLIGFVAGGRPDRRRLVRGSAIAAPSRATAPAGRHGGDRRRSRRPARRRSAGRRRERSPRRVRSSSIDHSIAAWSKNLAANPHDFLAATNLATLYQGRGRLSYDLERPRASPRRRHGPPSRSSRATRPLGRSRRRSSFTLHDFEAAFAAADALVARGLRPAGALATRFDAELELGRIDDARADLERLDRGRRAGA